MPKSCIPIFKWSRTKISVFGKKEKLMGAPKVYVWHLLCMRHLEWILVVSKTIMHMCYNMTHQIHGNFSRFTALEMTAKLFPVPFCFEKTFLTSILGQFVDLSVSPFRPGKIMAATRGSNYKNYNLNTPLSLKCSLGF